MLEDLDKYITNARKKGFSFDNIALRLETAGWNPYLVEHAISKQRNTEDGKSINTSIWFIVGIFSLVVLIVFGATTLGYNPNKDIYCLEPGRFSMIKQTNFAICCSYTTTPCTTGETYTLTNKAGNIIFASNNYCTGPQGDVIIRGDVMARC
mgnify:CR=1 FL=1